VVLGQSEAVGRALVEHPSVPRLSFTGSTAVGKAILAAAAPSLTHVTLELGGSNPVLVCGLGAEGGLEGLGSFTRSKTANLRFRGPVPSFPDFSQ
jgi:Aldehyde dehydrogenase family